MICRQGRGNHDTVETAARAAQRAQDGARQAHLARYQHCRHPCTSVCVCMYVRMCVCVCVCMYVFAYAPTVRTHVRPCVLRFCTSDHVIHSVGKRYCRHCRDCGVYVGLVAFARLTDLARIVDVEYASDHRTCRRGTGRQ